MVEVHFYDLTNDFDEMTHLSYAQRCGIIQQHSWDKDWMKNALEYFHNLSAKQRMALIDYTHRGDRLVNLWLRGDTDAVVLVMRGYDSFPFSKIARRLLEKNKETMETFLISGNKPLDHDLTIFYWLSLRPNAAKEKLTDEFLVMVVAEAARLLVKAIRNAPPLTKDVLLFRGVKTYMFEHGSTLVARGFVSTTTSGVVASDFAEKGGFVLRIHAPKGTHCLPIFESNYDDEFEVMLLPGSVLHQTACIPNFGDGDLGAIKVTLCDVQLGLKLQGIKRKHEALESAPELE